MKEDNVVQLKSYAFAVRITKVYKHLSQEKKEFVLSKQLFRSGMAIGANIEEALGGQSEKDFFVKITISYKEACETRYWIRLLTDTDFLTEEQSVSLMSDNSVSLMSDNNELLKIIGSIQKTIRGRKSVIRNFF